MLLTIDTIFERLKVQEQYHNAICVLLRECLLNPELNSILHDEFGEDVTRMMYEIKPDYDKPTSYDTEPMYKQSAIQPRKKKNNDKTTKRAARTTKQRTVNRTRGRQNTACG